MKTHIDNTIEEILNKYNVENVYTSEPIDIDKTGATNPELSAEGRMLVETSRELLVEELKAQSKRYADERVREFAAWCYNQGYDCDTSGTEEFINQNTESEKEPHPEGSKC